MLMIDLIRKKRDGGVLSADEIAWFVQEYVGGHLPDYQVSALLMAIWFRGMTDEETAQLTACMAASGEQVDLSRYGDLSVDKHSTGGVGDKTTLIIAPIVSALGLKMAKMSGRGLGHTGGTVDKLSAIDGFSVDLSPADFLRQVDEVGVAVIGQSGNLTPADKGLYALRDVTATVDSIPLIASSIMSKKLAAGAHTIVLDVKTGSGAFMQDPADAQKLADAMVAIGTAAGRKVAAILTDMDVPLGRAVGNALEVQEAIEVLRGGGPKDLRDVCVTLASKTVELGLNLSANEAKNRVEQVLDDGTAFTQFVRWVTAQGGKEKQLLHPETLPTATHSEPLLAPVSGCIKRMNAAQVGYAAMLLGGGRAKKDDVIDLTAGVRLCCKTGEQTTKGEPIAILYTSDPTRLAAAKEALLAAYEW